MSNWELEVDEAVSRLGDRTLYLEVGRLFVSLLPKTTEEMRSALAGGDLAELRRLCHSLKSNCATLGAEPAREAALAVEQAASAGDRSAAATTLARLEPLLDQLAGKLTAIC